MEDDPNNSKRKMTKKNSKWKTTKKIPNGRRPKNSNGRRPKKVKMENGQKNPNERRPDPNPVFDPEQNKTNLVWHSSGHLVGYLVILYFETNFTRTDKLRDQIFL